MLSELLVMGRRELEKTCKREPRGMRGWQMAWVD